MPISELILRALPSIPPIQPGDNLSSIILYSLAQADLSLQNGDILVVSSKIVSKSENRYVDLRQVNPSPQALQLGEQAKKDPRIVELVLQESIDVSRVVPNVLIVRHRLGFTSANAGIDQSNTGDLNGNIVLLLPEDPDKSAECIVVELEQQTGIRPAVVISDTHGRPFRLGNLNVAIGISGLPAIVDQRGTLDLFGRTLQATITAFADQVAAAAGLVSGEADEGQPVILVRGLSWSPEAQIGSAKDLIRPVEQDLYR
jgi:coenzyme F420-0:L-glutamate ligase/coenzyme F420-1:gamma-L-glutamate ligase